jgi:hypothetical protein
LHLVQREDWATIDLDVTNGHVRVRQDWHYKWSALPGLPPWTPEEKHAYHRAVDHLIWAHWSMRATIAVRRQQTRAAASGTARNLVARFPHRRLTLSFDVRKVSTRTQWLAHVVKLDPKTPPKEQPRPECYFFQRRLDLYDTSITKVRAARYPGDPKANPNFIDVPHEFGHALGYGNYYRMPDEYKEESAFRQEIDSIMNIGRRIRARHLFLIMATLEDMVPGCTFSASVEP